MGTFLIKRLLVGVLSEPVVVFHQPSKRSMLTSCQLQLALLATVPRTITVLRSAPALSEVAEMLAK